jgi:transcriptional regulator with XRE-family HTH domain
MEIETTDAFVGKRVSDLLWANRMTQSDLASRLGLDQSTLSKKLRGVRRWTAEEVVHASAALGVYPADLMPTEIQMLDELTPVKLAHSPAVAAMIAAGRSALVRPEGFEPPTY